MRTLAGPDASVAFTHLSRAASASLSTALADTSNSVSSPGDAFPTPPAQARVECFEQGVLALMQARNVPLEQVCLLDPKASEALTPADGDAGKFAWFLFGVRLLVSPPYFPILSAYLFGRLTAPWWFRVSLVRLSEKTCPRPAPGC